MNLPPFFEDLLAKRRDLRQIVDSAISEFEPWLNDEMPFFPEYTKHDMSHSMNVIWTACFLISNSSKNIFSADDAAVFILACLFHDCAMHLHEDGFLSLVNAKNDNNLVSGFNDKPWSKLWEDYKAEASRFDGNHNMLLFGSPEPVCIPDSNAAEWTYNQRKLIGEFIRRHHARLGHEIAMYGVPLQAVDNSIIRKRMIKSDNQFRHIADIAGLISRSHGTEIRSCFDYLVKCYDLREFRNTHIIFLMVLLRISDYVQIDASRAPRDTINMWRIRSPVSRVEWKSHQSVENISIYENDPESWFVKAKPVDIYSFLNIQNWLLAIQAELDASWAILGEVYGRFDELSNLGLVLRRVHTNITDFDNHDEYDYYPIEARLKVANVNMLQLLVGPLYGYKPEIAVRELLQNAVDAKLEADDYVNNIMRNRGVVEKDEELTKYDADIIVRVSRDRNGEAALEIIDSGIGMTLSTVVDYFLNVGASYRYSDSWKKMHIDEYNKERIAKSGRFGIGVLAAFIAGEEMAVETRHITSDIRDGISFRYNAVGDIIELKRINKHYVGTRVVVKLSEESWILYRDRTASWDWYCLNYPKVVRLIKYEDGHERMLEQKRGNISDEDDSRLRRVEQEKYDDVIIDMYDDNTLICNGIYIKRGDMRGIHVARRIEITPPGIYVTDRSGKMPLSLDRTGIDEGRSEINRIVGEDLLLDILTYAAAYAPGGSINTFEAENWYIKLGHYRMRNKIGIHERWPVWLAVKSGIIYLDPWILSVNGVRNVFMFEDPFHQIDGIDYGDDGENAYAITRKSVRGCELANNESGVRYIRFGRNVEIEMQAMLVGCQYKGMARGRWPLYEHKIVSGTDMILIEERPQRKWKEVMDKHINSIMKIGEERSEKKIATVMRVDVVEGSQYRTGISRAWERIYGAGAMPYEEKRREEIMKRHGGKIYEYYAVWKERKLGKEK